MYNRIISALFCSLLVGCSKESAMHEAAVSPAQRETQIETITSGIIPVEPLSMDAMVGIWLLLDSEGVPDKSGDNLTIEESGNEYIGLLAYQGSKKDCKLFTDGKAYWVQSQDGEKYEISRLRSMHPSGNNGIGLALITGFDDISLGFFQREDILKNLEGQ